MGNIYYMIYVIYVPCKRIEVIGVEIIGDNCVSNLFSFFGHGPALLTSINFALTDFRTGIISSMTTVGMIIFRLP